MTTFFETQRSILLNFVLRMAGLKFFKEEFSSHIFQIIFLETVQFSKKLTSIGIFFFNMDEASVYADFPSGVKRVKATTAKNYLRRKVENLMSAMKWQYYSCE